MEVFSTIFFLLATLLVFVYFKKRNNLAGLNTFGDCAFLGNIHVMKMAFSNSKIPILDKLKDFIGGMSKLFEKEGIYYIRIGLRNVVVLCSGRTAEVILKSKTQVAKGHFYDIARSIADGLVTMNDRVEHRKFRKHINPSFYNSVINEIYMPVMNTHSRELVKKLKSSYDKKYVDILKVIKEKAFNVILESGMGVYDENKSAENLQEKFDLFSKVWMIRQLNPLFKNEFMFSLTVLGRLALQAVEEWTSFINKVLTNRKLEFNDSQVGEQTEEFKLKRKAFLDLVLTEQKSNPDVFTDRDIFAQIFTFVAAGYDTTAVSLAWAIYIVGHHSEVQEKIHQEMDDIFGTDRKDDCINHEDLIRMKYLDKVIKESLRLYSTIPMIGRELTEDLVIDGRNINKGTTILIALDSIHKNSTDYIDPFLFNPEREFPDSCYVPFSFGTRDCIGKTFALIEMKIILSDIFRNLKVTSLDQRDTIFTTPSIVGIPNKPIRILIEHR